MVSQGWARIPVRPLRGIIAQGVYDIMSFSGWNLKQSEGAPSPIRSHTHRQRLRPSATEPFMLRVFPGLQPPLQQCLVSSLGLFV